MRETRSSGSVEGVMSNRDPYSDSCLRLVLRQNEKSPLACLLAAWLAVASGKPAIRAKYLAVDPAAVWASKE
jgi:hypothetical protein